MQPSTRESCRPSTTWSPDWNCLPLNTSSRRAPKPLDAENSCRTRAHPRCRSALSRDGDGRRSVASFGTGWSVCDRPSEDPVIRPLSRSASGRCGTRRHPPSAVPRCARISPRSRSVEPGTSGITLLDPSGCPRGGGDLLCGESGGGADDGGGLTHSLRWRSPRRTTPPPGTAGRRSRWRARSPLSRGDPPGGGGTGGWCRPGPA